MNENNPATWLSVMIKIKSVTNVLFLFCANASAHTLTHEHAFQTNVNGLCQFVLLYILCTLYMWNTFFCNDLICLWCETRERKEIINQYVSDSVVY